MGSSPPTRLADTSGRSAHGRTCECNVFVLPNAAYCRPTFMSSPPGSAGKVRYPSSTATPSSPNARKKSARAYGSTIACSDISDSGKANAGSGFTPFFPATPSKLAMTAMSGLKTFEPAVAAPEFGTVPDPSDTGAAVWAAVFGGSAVVGCRPSKAASRDSSADIRASKSCLSCTISPRIASAEAAACAGWASNRLQYATKTAARITRSPQRDIIINASTVHAHRA